MVGQTWSQPLAIDDVNASIIQLYPNPTLGGIYVKGIQRKSEIEVFTFDGRKLSSFQLGSNFYFDLKLSSGLYLVKMTSNGKSILKKIVVK